MANPRLVNIIVVFVLVGPLAGTTTFVACATVTMFASSDPAADLLWFASGVPMIIAFGYVLGALPALATGFVAAALIRRGLSFGRRLSWGAVAGAGVSLLVPGFVAFGPPGAVPVWVFLGNVAASGAVAAMAATLALEPFIRKRRGARSS